MQDLLTEAKKERDAKWPDSPWVFNREGGQIKDFRRAWEQACKRAGVPDVKFHDLRRTAVRNMRRDGVPQVVRMKISGHKTDSMERRYNIVDGDDISIAKSLMEARRKKVRLCPRCARRRPPQPGWPFPFSPRARLRYAFLCPSSGHSPNNGHNYGHSRKNKGPIISDRPLLTALESMVRRGGLEPPRDCSR